jgi:hypothetical protein
MPNHLYLRSNLADNPKVLQIAASLGIPDLHAIGLLYKLWSWADGLGTDGTCVKASGAVLDRLAGVPGFSRALREVGWLEGEDGALVLPGFGKYSFREVNKRERSSERVRKYRDAKRYTSVTGGVTEGVTGGVTGGVTEGVTQAEKQKPAKSRKHRKENSLDPEPSVTPDEFFTRYQEMAKRKGLAVPLDLTDSRRKKLVARLKDASWFDAFVNGTKKLPLGGNWQPDIDWFLANAENARKVAEGKYDNWKTPSAADPRGNGEALRKYLDGFEEGGIDESEEEAAGIPG